MSYIDEIAHEVESAIPEEQRPQDHALSLYRLYALLVLVRGDKTTRRDVHDAWSTWMVGIDPNHVSLVCYDELTNEVQSADDPYVAAIHLVARDRDTRRTSGSLRD